MYAARQIEETSFSFSSQIPAPPDRRRQERHIRILRVGVLFFDGRRELCLIRNISSGGLMAHVYSTVTPGERVTVELKTNQKVTGSIAWANGSDAGIAFDTPVDIVELLANPPVLDNGWRPRAPRVEVDRAATLRAADAGDPAAVQSLLARWLERRPQTLHAFESTVTKHGDAWHVRGTAIPREEIPAGVPRIGRGGRTVFDKRKAA